MSTSHRCRWWIGDVARDRQALALRRAHERHALRATTAGTGARARRSRARARGSSTARSSRRSAECRRGRGASRSRRRARRRRAPMCGSLRPQPQRIAERRRVLHRAQQQLRVDERNVGLRERDASCFGELGHLGQRLPCKPDRQRADRIDVRLVERARAVLQHLDQARLVERRIGVRRTGEARHAAGDRRRHLRLERRLVLEPGLAQPRGEVDEARARRRARARRSRASACQPAGAASTRGDRAVGDVQRAVAIDAAARDRRCGRWRSRSSDASVHASCRDHAHHRHPHGDAERHLRQDHRRARRRRRPSRSRRRGSSAPDASRSRRAWRARAFPASGRSS